MSINLNINPQKSFQFVKVFTSIVSSKTDIKIDSKLSQIKKFSKESIPTPKEIKNVAIKSKIKIQNNLTPQDRFIDIMV